ncbi:hypothetical protein [Algoriphagus halophilus]|uniref:Uncharacterized protein n=1 Tax=Algoriphagus halophilus TaxID=226505 RepID=A0A1N6E332_9BACT|nr:hypothetical protein [Algoriphagus halophilus]SIN77401.1 hypothetical protein SAMN05444394_1663 [Algoriphagus halophilus]
MENLSLQELQFFLEEDLFLLPEDAKKLKDQQSNSDQTSSLEAPNRSVKEVQETYESTISSTELAKEELPPIQVKGNFTKGLLIVHEEDDLSEEVMNMLVKMINAVGHSMNEVGLVSSNILENRTLEEFEALNAHTILKFGKIKHAVNSVPAIPYEVFTDLETQYLFADALGQIAEDNTLKRKLWNALQILFNIKK